MELDLLKPIFPKTVEFLKGSEGGYYQAWLRQELDKTDKLVAAHACISINYICTMFLSGNILAALTEPSVSSLKINQHVHKTLALVFQNKPYRVSLEKIKKMVFVCVEKILTLINIKNMQVPTELISLNSNLNTYDNLVHQLGSEQKRNYQWPG